MQPLAYGIATAFNATCKRQRWPSHALAFFRMVLNIFCPTDFTEHTDLKPNLHYSKYRMSQKTFVAGQFFSLDSVFIYTRKNNYKKTNTKNGKKTNFDGQTVRGAFHAYHVALLPLGICEGNSRCAEQAFPELA